MYNNILYSPTGPFRKRFRIEKLVVPDRANAQQLPPLRVVKVYIAISTTVKRVLHQISKNERDKKKKKINKLSTFFTYIQTRKTNGRCTPIDVRGD